MRKLTRQQERILRLIREHIDASGAPPTRAEICRAMGFRSPNAAEEHLRALVRKGEIQMTAGISRGIKLMRETVIPVVGRVAAGMPILASQHIETHCRIDPLLFRPHADYLLRVRGFSMRDAGILDDDLLVIHRAREFRTGQIVVARIDDEVTVKRIRKRRHIFELLPENPAFEPIVVDMHRQPLVLEGIVVGLIRTRGMT